VTGESSPLSEVKSEGKKVWSVLLSLDGRGLWAARGGPKGEGEERKIGSTRRYPKMAEVATCEGT
jgi:hypothetical protein